MRTTINLPDGLVQQAKAQAAAEGRTLTSLIAEGLREVLDRERTQAASAAPLPVFGDPAGRPLVDLLDKDAMWAALDGGRVR